MQIHAIVTTIPPLRMKISAGILLYRLHENQLQVFLVHPGGPFWKNKDLGAWSIPKGEVDNAGDDLLSVARREFEEETGYKIDGKFIELKPFKTKGGKQVHAWAVEGNIDPATIVSNTFPLEWPPKSGKNIQVPEVDRGEWFETEIAKQKINQQQVVLIDELVLHLRIS
jgi:predicted NUDIX family NTP pyrophosphohydrolase